jgi:hypothetical protein
VFELRADQGVPDLAGRTGGPAVHAPVEHESTADACPNCDHHEVPDGQAGAVVGFR